MNEVICGDCLEIMRTFKDKQFDLVLTDPPYGIAYNNDDLNRKSNASYEDIENDGGEIDYSALIRESQRIAKRTIIFGALNFLPAIPYKGVWICWDKRTTVLADKVFGSPYEMAWCDKVGGYDKIYRIMHGGVINNDGANQPRMHPTQKPVELMRRIINDFTREGDTILDPFAGSGTTGVAAKQLKRNCTLIEISPKYVEIIKSRLSQEMLF
jgi:DNA modification methylase